MYSPKVNDRVRYVSRYQEHEGWVYCITDDYFTLEVATKPKADDLVSMHKKHHVLIVVYNQFYNQIEYLGYRESIHHDTIITDKQLVQANV